MAGISFGLHAQVLDNREGKAFTDRPFFNTDFIRTNKVKRLNGTFTYKKSGDRMRETTYHYVYDFDSLGQLISTYETRTDDGTRDTTWNFYFYDEVGNLVKHRKTDLEGFQTVDYTHDSIGRILTEHYMRELVDENGRIERTLSFNNERSTYADYDRQIKRTRYNNYDLPYLDEYFNYNEYGYLTERIERIKTTSTVYTHDYEYNEQGKLAAIRKSSNREEGYLEEFTFRYDELGNLIERHEYKKGVFTTDIQVIYSSKSKLLSAILTKQVSTGFILILRFKDVEFYD